MKRKILLAAASSALCAVCAKAQTINPDSLRAVQLNEIIVSASAAPKDAPFAVSKIGKTELEEFSSQAKELPFLLSKLPGVVAWGDNGLSTGTSYLRIRGAGGSRINVTLDGVPLNSPEDQTVFWSNMSGYSSYLGAVTLQRGVGSSSNGDGAFGGTIALMSANPSYSPGGSVNVAYGSYNTYKLGFNLSSGMLQNGMQLDCGYQRTASDGFLHGTAGKAGSGTLGLQWKLGDQFVLKYRNLLNYERTGQAWNGVETGDLLDGTYGVKTGIYGYPDMYRMGLGQYNSLYESLSVNEKGEFVLTPYGRSATDNFLQDHNMLSFSWSPDFLWNLGATLHYTYGSGYYDEFKPDCKLSKFGLNFKKADGSELLSTDFVRNKGLNQHTFGLIAGAQMKSSGVDLRFGVSVQQFLGNHYGFLTYIADEELRSAKMADGDYKYYDSDARKTDASAYVKFTCNFDGGFSVFADIQYRFVNYFTNGYNDKFLKQPDGTWVNQVLNVNQNYSFFNPKAGIRYKIAEHTFYLSMAMANREPERNNFTDNGSYPAPKPEDVLDFELGYELNAEKVQIGANLYYMAYHNQLVQTGALSDVGEALTTNIARSYRTGLELTAQVQACRWLDIDFQGAFSINKIQDFDEVVDDWDAGDTRTIHYSNSTLAFSPSAVLSADACFHFGEFKGIWRTSYVSRQYLDNTSCIDRSIPGYSTTDINLSYDLHFKSKYPRCLTFGLLLGNIFDSHHACSGWVYSAISESLGHPNEKRYTQMGYFPSAGFNAMLSLDLKF